jgi:peptide-methionine (S)-S-oxide reductase
MSQLEETTMKAERRILIPLLIVALVFGMIFLARPLFTNENEKVTENEMGSTDSKNTQLATFGGGCFWCVEAVYERIEGVTDVVSGYAGGAKDNPTYEEVSSGSTGHAEVVQIAYDPEKIDYDELLDLFWQAHDPTTLNRQGADVGTQYRSIILYHDEDQKMRAERSMAKAANDFKDPIVTEIQPLTKFYVAEDYHQDFYNNNKTYGYCRVVITPKLKKLGLD